jgi:hypothetical protein
MREDFDIIRRQEKLTREVTLALDGKQEVFIEGENVEIKKIPAKPAVVEISDEKSKKIILENWTELSSYTLEIMHMSRAFQWILSQYKIEPTEEEFKIALLMTKDDFNGRKKDNKKEDI